MKKIRFTSVLTDEENRRLKALTYFNRFGENRSAYIRHLIDEAWKKYEASNGR